MCAGSRVFLAARDSGSQRSAHRWAWDSGSCRDFWDASMLHSIHINNMLALWGSQVFIRYVGIHFGGEV